MSLDIDIFCSPSSREGLKLSELGLKPQETNGPSFQLPCKQQQLEDRILFRNRSSHYDAQGYCIAVVALLKKCAKQQDLTKGRKIHTEICNGGFLASNIFVFNSLVNMYAKCGELEVAEEVVHDFQISDVVCWNALIAGYIQHHRNQEALTCFEKMQLKGLSPTVITLTCIIKVCGNLKLKEKGDQMHAAVINKGFLEKDAMVGTGLVDMYCKCNAFVEAQVLFDRLPFKDVAAWNVLISGLAKNEYSCEALECFQHMQEHGPPPDVVTFTCILKACCSIGTLEKLEELHAEGMRQGFMKTSVMFGTGLMEMYAKCGNLPKAEYVFDELPVRDLFSWSVLITAYTQHGHALKALQCFEQMREEGQSPNGVIFASVLNACGSIFTIAKGEEIYAEVVNKGLLEKDSIIVNALIDMYAKCGEVEKARKVFDDLPECNVFLWNALITAYASSGLLRTAHEVFDDLKVRDVISWGALISGYVRHGHNDEALICFEHMELEGIPPNDVIFIEILKACGAVGAIEKGEEAHNELVRQGLLGTNPLLSNALVDMYAKCGVTVRAREVFNDLPCKDVFSWSSLLAAYAQYGKTEIVSRLFEEMARGIEPNTVTFVLLLNACNHSGLLEEGCICYGDMSICYNIIPTSDHQACMVDLFARAGHVGEAMDVIESLSLDSLEYYPVLSVLLAACRKWGNAEIGKFAFEYVMQMNEMDASAYTCIHNIYATACMIDEGQNI